MNQLIVFIGDEKSDGRAYSVQLIEKAGFECLSLAKKEDLTKISKNKKPLAIISDRNHFLVPEETIKFVEIASLNIHPSLLPSHPGSYSLFWSLIFGDEFGVTAHHMSSTLDDGPIAYQQKIEYLSDSTFREVYELSRLASLTLTQRILMDLKRRKEIKKINQHSTLKRKKHTKKSTLHLIEMLPNGWDTTILEARQVLSGKLDINERVIL